MPDCYLLAVCSGSALDQSSNNFSLFGLVEQLQVREAPSVLPLEVHVYWEFEPAELNEEFEMRLVLIRDGRDLSTSAPIPFHSATPRFRIRLAGFEAREPGSFHLKVDWQRPGSSNWNRMAISWPIQVEVLGEQARRAESP